MFGNRIASFLRALFRDRSLRLAFTALVALAFVGAGLAGGGMDALRQQPADDEALDDAFCTRHPPKPEEG